MKKIICFIASTVMTIGLTQAKGYPAFLFNPVKPGATLEKFWVDYDATSNGEYGMMIHADITLYDLKETEVSFSIYFKMNDDDPGSYLQDKNGRYKASSGEVSTGKYITPSYTTSIFEDLQVFMPYDELELDAGTHELTMQVDLNRRGGGTIAWLKMHDFTYTQYEAGRGPKNTAKLKVLPAEAPRVDFDKLWTDHNVDQNGEKGMMFHFRFTTHNMQDMEAYVAAYFRVNDSTRTLLKDMNGKFNSSDGLVAVYRLIKPGISPGWYEDLTIFMPYDELDITQPGVYELIMDSKVIYKQGGLISNLGFYELTYTLEN